MAAACCGRSVKGRCDALHSGTTEAAAHAISSRPHRGCPSSVQCKRGQCSGTFAVCYLRSMMARTRTAFLALLLCACTDPPRPFSLPKDIEDLRARLLVSIPEGRDIEGARAWMRDHGFQSDPPMPSAADAHASS